MERQRLGGWDFPATRATGGHAPPQDCDGDRNHSYFPPIRVLDSHPTERYLVVCSRCAAHRVIEVK